MAKEVKAATLTVTELVNATEVASIEQSNTNNMEKKEISENGNAANAASNELKSGEKTWELNLPLLKLVLMVKCKRLS